MRNGSLRVVVDTNIYYSFLYNPFGDIGKLVLEAVNGSIELYSPDIVYEEIRRLLTKDFKVSEEKAIEIIESLPVKWIDRYIYADCMDNTKIIKHESDRPILALALALKCGILSFDNHFRPAKKIVKLWNIKELIE